MKENKMSIRPIALIITGLLLGVVGMTISKVLIVGGIILGIIGLISGESDG